MSDVRGLMKQVLFGIMHEINLRGRPREGGQRNDTTVIRTYWVNEQKTEPVGDLYCDVHLTPAIVIEAMEGAGDDDCI